MQKRKRNTHEKLMEAALLAKVAADKAAEAVAPVAAGKQSKVVTHAGVAPKEPGVASVSGSLMVAEEVWPGICLHTDSQRVCAFWPVSLERWNTPLP